MPAATGGEGRCITFYSYKDIQKLEKFMQGKPIAEQEIGKLLLLETVSYAESSMCRRKTLLHYFGEEYTEENCGCCDNCVHPKPKVHVKEEMGADARSPAGDRTPVQDGLSGQPAGGPHHGHDQVLRPQHDGVVRSRKRITTTSSGGR